MHFSIANLPNAG